MGWKRVNEKRRFKISYSFIKYFAIVILIFSIALIAYGQRNYKHKISMYPETTKEHSTYSYLLSKVEV